MTVTTGKATVFENVFKNFYDLLNSNGSFTSIIYPAFPEGFDIDDKGDYPLCILDSADLKEEQLSFGKSYVDGTIGFEIYTTSAATTDQYASDAKDQIETSKTTLAGVGLHRVFLDSSSKDTVQRGKINVHFIRLNFRFRFFFAKTFAY